MTDRQAPPDQPDPSGPARTGVGADQAAETLRAVLGWPTSDLGTLTGGAARLLQAADELAAAATAVRSAHQWGQDLTGPVSQLRHAEHRYRSVVAPPGR